MAQINARDVMAMYGPAVEAFNIEKGKSQMADTAQSQANINFDRRVMNESLPLTRMLDTSGEFNADALKEAKPFSDPYDIWNDLQTQMPGNRRIDPIAFQQQVEMGQSLFDRNYANQIAQMEESGKSMKEIRKYLKGNEELYDYAMQRGIIPREPEGWNWGGMGKALGQTGLSIGAGYGTSRYLEGKLKGKPKASAIRSLRAEGLRVVNKDGKRFIEPMSDKEMYKKPKVRLGDKGQSPSDAVRKAEDAVRRKKASRNIKIRDDKVLQKATKGNQRAVERVLKSRATKPTGLLGRIKAPGRIGAAITGISMLASMLPYMFDEE